MLTSEIKALAEGAVPALSGRCQLLADLSLLMKRGAWPAAPVAAFILPLGFRARSQGDASANAFTQALDEMAGILIVINAAGDPTGGKALPGIDEIVDQLLAAICGVAPGPGFGVLRAVRGQLIDSADGRIVYQLDFATEKYVRILS